VPNDSASNTEGFLSRDTCISSIQMSRLIGTKRAYLYLENPKMHRVFLSKIKSIITVKQLAA
jgi:hypothetical protein